MDSLTPLPDEAPWFVRWLVANWRTIWREFSTWFIGLAGAIALLPPDIWQQLGLSEPSQRYATTVCAVVALLCKFVRQPSIEEKS